jgi:predicted RND superfamily exporter protein
MENQIENQNNNSNRGTSIVEHFYNIFNYLVNSYNALSTEQDESKKNEITNKLNELKEYIQTDIEQINDMLNISLEKKEEDLNNPNLSQEVKDFLASLHDGMIDIHDRFLSIAESFIEFIDTLNPEILDNIKDSINNSVIKLDEFKEINKQLKELLEKQEFNA